MQLYLLFSIHVLSMQLVGLNVKPPDKILVQLSCLRCQFIDLVLLFVQHVVHDFHGFDQKLAFLFVFKHIRQCIDFL